ncbi:MAG: heavy metal translocating P-type ATPase [Granulosicoccus sp.]
MRCYHCAEPVPESGRWQVRFDDVERDVCCAGCQAVMQAIVDTNLGDYYRFRTEPAQFGVIPDDLSARLDELAVFDEPEISDRYLRVTNEGDSEGLVEVNLSVQGLRCGACVWVLERSVAALPGVDMARVNFSSARATVRFNPNRLTLSSLLGRITQVGYRTTPFDVRERELSLRRESRAFMQRLFIAGIAAMQVMMYALPAYITDAGDIEREYEQLFRWSGLVLTSPVLLYSAQPFLKGAFNDLRHRQPGMDVPVSIGILAAFIASVWATVTASGEIYFDSVAMFVFLLLGARYLEWSVRRRAMRAVDDISCAAPETAQRVNADSVEVIPAIRLAVGDIIVVNNGDRVPVDATIHTGSSSVNNALVTGESVPVAVGPGDIIAGGALLTGAPVRLKVLRHQAASTLSVIDRLVDRGSAEKPRAVMIADRIATVFVTVLLCFSLLVWGLWMMVDSTRAATTAIAVLVVSCPCALSLATPAALAAATGELLKRRLLITRGHALETLSRVTDVVFDKTGTLTQGKPSLVSFVCADGMNEDTILNIAVAMEIGSTHPYANALRDYQQLTQGRESEQLNDDRADARVALDTMGYQMVEISHQAGHGVSAHLDDGDCLFLGSARWCKVSPDSIMLWCRDETTLASESSEVFLSHQDADGEVLVLARFLLADALRHNVASMVDALRLQGMKVHLLSGDRLPAVQSVARVLDITRYAASATPEDKQSYVRQLQDTGSVVLMIGDGINDAPVLAAADVSMAVGDATALARTAADVISMLPGLDGLPLLLGKSAQTTRIVRQNLAWAATYNALAIPMAALGYVPPWAAAIGMALSSLLVAGNAQRLWSREKDYSMATDAVVSPG